MTNEQKSQEICDKMGFKNQPYLVATYREEVEQAIEEGMQWKEEQIFDLLRSEVLSAHLHGGEIDEVLSKLDEKMKGE